MPARIELVGDAIKTIRRYAPETQRSVTTVDRLKVVPLREIVRAGAAADGMSAPGGGRSTADSGMVGVAGPRVPVFDYLGITRRPVIVASEPDEIRERIEKQLTQISKSYEHARAAAGGGRRSPAQMEAGSLDPAAIGIPVPGDILVSWPDIARALSSAFVLEDLGLDHPQVVHRDIKPENVMLQEGEPQVTDFGIAKAVTASVSGSLTQTGPAIGTPAYMSPEQAGGEPNIDARTDIYSLGAVLYELIAGSAPFTGPTTQAVIAKVFTEPPPPLAERRDGVPDWLERVVMKSLSKAPGDRYATAAQFAQALTWPVGGATPPGMPSASAPITAKSIAVLPFVNMSNDPENEYFTDGMRFSAADRVGIGLVTAWCGALYVLFRG